MGLTTRGSYNQGFSKPGVLTIRGLYQCILHGRSVPRCWYWSLFLTVRGSNQRVLHDRSAPRCWYWSLFLTYRGSNQHEQVSAQLYIYIDHNILQLGVCVDHKSSAFPVIRCWYWPYNVTFMWNLCPNVYSDGKILYLGVCTKMSI